MPNTELELALPTFARAKSTPGYYLFLPATPQETQLVPYVNYKQELAWQYFYYLSTQTQICDLCYNYNYLSNFCTLWDCKHKVCIGCLGEYLSYKIKIGHCHDDKLLCLICQEGKHIPQTLNCYLITVENRNIIGEKQYRYLIRKVQYQNSEKIYCPHYNCRWILDPPTTDFFKCIECQTEYCKDCNKEAHHNRTCDEYAQYLERLVNDDPVFLEYMKENNLQICPHCGFRAEKDDGCPYMNCDSPVCNGENAFCYLCGCVLTEDLHWSHFLDNWEKCKTNYPNWEAEGLRPEG